MLVFNVQMNDKRDAEGSRKDHQEYKLMYQSASLCLSGCEELTDSWNGLRAKDLEQDLRASKQRCVTAEENLKSKEQEYLEKGSTLEKQM